MFQFVLAIGLSWAAVALPRGAHAGMPRGIEKFQQFSKLKLIWSASGEGRNLQIPAVLPSTLPSGSLMGPEPRTLRESGQTFGGAFASEFVDLVLFALAPDERSSVDLLIFKDVTGAQLLVPRATLVRYPILLASHGAGKVLDAPSLVFPWHTKPKLESEPTPFRNLKLGGLAEIEFSNYRFHFDRLLLKRRTDPSAIRGEKIVLQNCVSCHAVGRGPNVEAMLGPGRLDRLVDQGHPKVDGARDLDPKERRAVRNYWSTYQLEQASDKR